MQGCASQVWLATSVAPDGASGPVLTFSGDSDAHIVRGLIAVLFGMVSGKPAPEIAGITSGTTKSITFTFDGPGPFAFACHAPGHFEAGMKGTITLVGG